MMEQETPTSINDISNSFKRTISLSQSACANASSNSAANVPVSLASSSSKALTKAEGSFLLGNICIMNKADDNDPYIINTRSSHYIQ